MFGAGSEFIATLRRLVHARGPIIPIIGDGLSLTQPIWIEDVVSCFVAALARPETAGHAYDLGGPETFGFEELLDLVAEEEGIEKRKLHLHVAMMRPAVAILSRLVPSFPLTPDQLTMLLEDNVCDIAEMKETFGIEPARLREHLGG
jgi:uncharacterized protein YbjT (DUF2867 family)